MKIELKIELTHTAGNVIFLIFFCINKFFRTQSIGKQVKKSKSLYDFSIIKNSVIPVLFLKKT